MKEAIQQAIQRRGFALTDSIPGVRAFLGICGELGTVMSVTEVRLKAATVRRPQRPEGLSLHTDPVTAGIVGWYCVWPPQDSEPTRLVDGRRVLERLDARWRDALRWVEVASDDFPTGESFVAPLVAGRMGSETISFSSDHVRPPRSWLEERACLEWSTALREVEKSNFIDVEWVPGRALFVDNHRMLHGRRALGSESERYLIRAWVDGPSGRHPYVAATPRGS